MKNRKVLVTGGSRGIGKVIVEQLIKQGYEVYAPTRDELELASAESIRAFVNAHAEDGYDIIINNAGINDIHNIDEITDDEILVKVISDSICMSTYKCAILGTEHKRVHEDVAEHPAIMGHEFAGDIIKV